MLFAALAWLQNTDETRDKLNAITYVFATVGILTALNTMWSTHQSDVAIKRLLRKWQRYAYSFSENYPKWDSYEPVIGLSPGTWEENPKEWKIEESIFDISWETFLLPWYPYVFVACWLAIILITVIY